ncbi:MAG TPA: SusC/RagA family TonB-linked outer membrane protein, partial [Gemmatimonadaceae bacterium]|nr:SusC/RagA family TonB-linked outer membrane protein [Gemmatimonadaceae bacterium]
MRLGRRTTWLAALLASLLGSGVAIAQDQRGTVTGRVTEQEGGQPIQDARVFVIGTTLGASTDTEGRFTVRGVPAGTVNLRAIRIGYAEATRSVSVAAGGTATVDFALAKTALQLSEVVTTATGEQRRLEVGNSIARVDVATVTQTKVVPQLSDVLQARTPGVAVNQGTQSGAGAKIRVRGQGSLNLQNDPIYIIDGVRATSLVTAQNVNNTVSTSGIQASNLFTGGAQPSRVQDINPEEIETIEIVKGPSAATLYGTDAANGVIVITTKRGRAGPARWNAYAEYGILEDNNTYPYAYTNFGRTAPTATAPNGTPIRCDLPQIALGTCASIDSTRTLNIFEEPDLTPLGRGDRQQYGLQVSGGTEVVRYFVGGEYEAEGSPVEMPQFEVDRLRANGIGLRGEWLRLNKFQKRSFRANLNATVNPRVDVAVSTNFINIDQRLHLESNATAGIGSQIFGGPGSRNATGNSLSLDTGEIIPLRGYRAYTPGLLFQEYTGQSVNRFIASANVNWRPTSWLANRMNVGSDYTAQHDLDFLRNGQGAPLTSTYRLGFRDDSRTATTNLTVDLGSTATWQALPALNSKTTVGAQYIYARSDLTEAIGEELPTGGTDVDGAATQTAVEETTDQKTLGLFIEEALSWNDRLFVTAAVRSDQNSAFGTDFEQVFYPKASISWIASQEGFFPQTGWLDEFRFRAAYGASGTQPGPNDALRSFGTNAQNYKAEDVPGLRYIAIGNPDLKPERATEFETGFDTRLFQSRVNLEVTYYNKKTDDALINAVVPPSYGAALNVRRNLGAVRNQGWELLLNSQVVDRPSFGWDVTVTGSTNKNRLLSIGGLPPVVGTTTRAQVGYPLFGLWARPYQYIDRNNDGILVYRALADGTVDRANSEVIVEDSSQFVGSSAPTRLATL